MRVADIGRGSTLREIGGGQCGKLNLFYGHKLNFHKKFASTEKWKRPQIQNNNDSMAVLGSVDGVARDTDPHIWCDPSVVVSL